MASVVGFRFTPPHHLHSDLITWQSIGNVLMTSGLLVLGWFARTLYEAIETLKDDFGAHKVEVARDYVRNNELDRLIERMDAGFDRISDRLDRAGR